MNTLALLFTHGVSLNEWKKSGLLDRELTYYNYIASQGIIVEFYPYGDTKEQSILESNSRIIVKTIGNYKKSILYKLLKINTLKTISFIIFNARRSTIIKTNQLKSSLPAIFLKYFFNKPLLLRVGYEPLMNRLEGNKSNRVKSFLIRFFSYLSYNAADKIIVTTIEIKNFIKTKYRIDYNKIHILPNWIDTKKFRLIDKSIRSKRILFVGRLEDEKNPLLLLEAVIRLKLPATFIGYGKLYEKMINRLKAEKSNLNIKFIKSVKAENMPDYFNSHSIYAITSKYEGNPKSLLEAMACECHILANNIIGLNSIIKDRYNGVLYEGSLRSLESSLLYIWENYSECEIYAKRAKQALIKNNNLISIANKEIELINLLAK
tara:strand:+ start:12847 stop:13977 length:1131 start_codon:yes stop_codon:yes gene_type:complete